MMLAFWLQKGQVLAADFGRLEKGVNSSAGLRERFVELGLLMCSQLMEGVIC